MREGGISDIEDTQRCKGTRHVRCGTPGCAGVLRKLAVHRQLVVQVGQEIVAGVATGRLLSKSKTDKHA